VKGFFRAQEGIYYQDIPDNALQPQKGRRGDGGFIDIRSSFIQVTVQIV